MSKRVNVVTIVGGEDGPTTIFTIGQKEKNILKRFQIWMRRKKYQRKRDKVRKTITAGAHTMEELIAYLQQRYDAVEADGSYPYYEERKRGMKYCLIQREKPELLGEMKRFFPPEDLTDKEAVIKWQKELDTWTKECQDKAEAVPYEAFPTKYHMFVIDRGQEGRLEVELDMFQPVLQVSYTGKAMAGISEDIHRYYGVTQQDIDEESERYKSLLAVLSTR